MNAMIIGASGFVGRHLAASLPEAILVGRSSEKIHKLFGKREAREWDGSSNAEPNFLGGIDTIFHLAGESVFHGRWNATKKERIRSSRVENTRHLVDIMAKAEIRPKVLVCSSAIGYYGSRGDEPLTEESTPGNDFLAQVCMDWEKEAMRAEEFGVRVVLIRTGVVLGSDGGALAQMATPFKMVVGGKLGSGRQYMSWVHVDDLVGLMLFAAKKPSLRGPVNGVSPHPLRNSEFTRILASVLHRPAILPAPGFALRVVLGEFAEVLLGSQHCVPEKLLQQGYNFKFPELQPALEDLL